VRVVVYGLDALAEGLKALRERGVDGVVIGSTSFLLRVGVKEFEDDVDLFTTTISPSFDEEVIMGVAEELGCFTGQTGWGTPQLRCSFRGSDIVFEFYENIYDFYVPEAMLQDADVVKVKGVDVRLLRVEDYLILKARAGRAEDEEDLKEVGKLIKQGKLSIRKEIIYDRMKLFEEYEEGLILRKIREAGISI